jgi:hypothetical protein
MVAVAQHLLTLSAALFMVYAAYRLRSYLTFFTGIAMVAYVGNSYSLYYDSSLLTESLFSSLMVFSFAFLVLSVASSSRRSLYFGLASSFMGALIVVRPAGMYFLVIYGFIAAYLLWNKYDKHAIIAFLIPFPALLLLLSTVTYVATGRFSASTFGEANLALATVSFWRSDPAFPPEVNQAIEKLPDLLVQRAQFKKRDRFILNNSWNPYMLYRIFYRMYSSFLDYGYGKRFETPERQGYIANRDLIRKVSLYSIRKQPHLYAKFVWANSFYYFLNITNTIDPYGEQKWMLERYISVHADSSGNLVENMLAREYLTHVGANGEIVENRVLQSARRALQPIISNIFHREIWIWAYFLMFGLSTVVLAASKGRHDGAFILFILTVSVIGSCLTVSLVEISLPRYSFPSQFVYYLSIAFSPLLKMKHINTDNIQEKLNVQQPA